MNPIDDFLAALGKWPEQDGPWIRPVYERVTLAIDPEWLTDRDAVRQRIDAFLCGDQAQGWVETTDRVLSVRSGGALPDAPVLNAELCALATRHDSLHVRQIDGGWRLMRMVEGGCSEEYLVSPAMMANADPNEGDLCYRVYSILTEDGRLETQIARFTGFKEN